MDIGKSFSFIFEDPRWLTKVLIGSVVLIIAGLLSPILIGILGYFIVQGYALEVLRRVRNGDPTPLPEWQDRWSEWLILGAKLAVAVFVWSLPAILLSIPMALGFAVTENGSDLSALGGLLGACFSCLLFLWVVVVLLAQPAIFIRLAEREQLSDAFQFGEILQFTRDHVGQVIIATLVYVAASFVIGLIGFFLGAVLCLVGLIITLPAAQLITMLVQSHLYAQIGSGRQLQTMAPPPPAAPYVPDVTESAPVDTVQTQDETVL